MSDRVGPALEITFGSSKPILLWCPPNDSPLFADPRNRVELARSSAVGVFNICCWFAMFAGLTPRRHRRRIEALEWTGPGLFRLDPNEELAYLNNMTDLPRKVVEVMANAIEVSIGPIATHYDRASSGPVTIGGRTETHVHAAALTLGRRMMKVFDAHRDELLPMAGWDPSTCPSRSCTDDEQIRLSKLWARKAKRFHGRVLDLVGANHASDRHVWLALSRTEAAKVAAALPVAEPETTASPVRSSFEKLAIEVLSAAGRRLTGVKLLTAMRLDPDSGSNKALLSNMVDRGDLDSDRRKGGYGLPEGP